MLVTPHQYVVARTQNLEKPELQVLTADPLATFNATFESAAKKLKNNEKTESNFLPSLGSGPSGSAQKTYDKKSSGSFL